MRPVGASYRVPIRARIVAATNRDLAAMVENGGFRKDLFYRLNVVNLRLPALRDRREDIPLLAAHFLDRISRERKTRFTLSDEALRIMMDYSWPGNVRELEHAVERACTFSSGPVLYLGDFPTQLQQQGIELRHRDRPTGTSRKKRPPACGHSPTSNGRRSWTADPRAQGRQTAGRAAAGHRENYSLPETQGIRHRRPHAGRMRTVISGQ